jgi:hypothetical protein
VLDLRLLQCQRRAVENRSAKRTVINSGQCTRMPLLDSAGVVPNMGKTVYDAAHAHKNNYGFQGTKIGTYTSSIFRYYYYYYYTLFQTNSP